jgi:hypothetical protein
MSSVLIDRIVRAAALVLVAGCVAPAAAAIRTVTNTNNSGEGSLRYALIFADPGDTITFDLTYPAVIRLQNELSFSKNVIIDGPGADRLRLDGDGNDQFFMLRIAAGVAVVFNQVQISNSYSIAIDNNGDLTLNDAVVSYNPRGPVNNFGTLTANDTVFTENRGAGQSGAIANYGTATFNRCVFSNNQARTTGGAMLNDAGATLVVNDSTFVGNAAGSSGNFNRGGALFNAGTATLKNTTFSQNISGPDGRGGAIENTGALTLDSITFSANVATAEGTGISNYGTATVRRTVIADSCSGTALMSAGDNLGSDSSCFAAASALNDSANVSLLLGALRDNGGPTPTVALLPGSPAIDAVVVNAAGCSGTDQRGVARPLGVRCDSGAFERDPDRVFEDGFE